MKLTLDDIDDLRAYERQRDERRAEIIALKRDRRVTVGPFITFVFENRDTVRFQIQEMARVEKLITDEAIENELAAYNPLIPDPGQLTATLFIELTDKASLMEWLPRLVGIEAEAELRVGDHATPVRCAVDPAHLAQLTRETTTASVHYVTFDLPPALVEAFPAGPVVLALTHPEYRHEVVLSDRTRASLAADLAG